MKADPSEHALKSDSCVRRSRLESAKKLFGAILVLGLCALLCDVPLWHADRNYTFYENVQIGEAQSWWEGRMDLPERVYDSALRNGRAYSYFPPMYSFVAALIVPFFDGVPYLTLVLLASAIPLLAYRLFYDRTQSLAWSILLALGLVCGTSAWPVIEEAIRTGAPYHVNHVLSTIGILVLLIDFFGRRRLWPAVIGLAITVWSRQMTVALAFPLIYLAWQTDNHRLRRRRIRLVVGGLTVILGVFALLNTLKFGHPLTTGYMLNHEGRDDVFAREAREHGIFSVHWIPRNLYYSNIGPPKIHGIEVAGERQTFVRPNTMGTGIWWTSPILLWVLLLVPRFRRSRSEVILLIGAAAIFALLMFWHATGAVQRGYNRYSLDYIPILFALLAPYVVVGQRRWLTLTMLAWSFAYFVYLLPLPHWRL